MRRQDQCFGSGRRTTTIKDRGEYYATGSCGTCGRAGMRLTVDERTYQHHPNRLASAMGVTYKMLREWPLSRFDKMKYDAIWKPDAGYQKVDKA